jgi:hypothetical protein
MSFQGQGGMDWRAIGRSMAGTKVAASMNNALLQSKVSGSFQNFLNQSEPNLK